MSGKGQHRGKFVNAHQARLAKIEAAKKKREDKERQEKERQGLKSSGTNPEATQGTGEPMPDSAK